MNMRQHFVAAAIRTAPHLLKDDVNFTLSGLGIAGEAIEAYEVINQVSVDKQKLVKELGDVCWYMALASYIHDIAFPPLFTSDISAREAATLSGVPKWALLSAHGKELLYAAKNTSEYIKKGVYHHHPVDKQELTVLLSNLGVKVQYVAAAIGSTIDEVLTTNIAKLQVRYPERFTTEGSLRKNEAAE